MYNTCTHCLCCLSAEPSNIPNKELICCCENTFKFPKFNFLIELKGGKPPHCLLF